MNALIKQNTPCCPICEGNPILGAMTGNYGMITHEGKNYCYFERYCLGSCRESYTYYVDISLDNNIRHSFDADISEVNDED